MTKNRFLAGCLTSLILVSLFAGIFPGYSQTLTRRLVGAQDVSFSVGGTGAAETFTYTTSDGYVLTLNKLDAAYLNFRQGMNTVAHAVENLINGSMATYRLYSTFPALITQIGANHKTIEVWNEQAISTSVTVPANVSVVMTYPGKFTKSGSGALIINGPFTCARYQCFSGFTTGITFGPKAISEIYPEWWGAIADGATDSSIPLNAAIYCAYASGIGTVSLPSGVIYTKTTTISHYPYVKVKGSNSQTSEVLSHATVAWQMVDTLGGATTSKGETSRVSLEDFTLNGDSTTTGADGVHWYAVSHSRTLQFQIKNFLGTGIEIAGGGTSATKSWHNTHNNLIVISCGIGQKFIDGAGSKPDHQVFIGGRVEGCSDIGIDSTSCTAAAVSWFGTRIVDNTNYGIYHDSTGTAWNWICCFFKTTAPSDNNITFTANTTKSSIQSPYFPADSTIAIVNSGVNNSIPSDISTFHTATTTDATPTTVFAENLADETSYLIECKIVGNASAGAQRATYIRRALVYRTAAGNATIQGAVQDGLTVESDAAWDATIVVTGTTVGPQVTGKAATTILWRSTMIITSYAAEP